MKKKRKPSVPLPAAAKAAVVLAVALAAVCLAGLTGIAGRPTRIWRDWYTLLVRSDRVPAAALDKVARALGPGVITGRTATVSFWSFTGVQSVPVDQADARIDPSDPRHDKVIEGLPAYFQRPGPDGWSIAYIPARRAAAVDYVLVAKVLGLRGSWRLVEFDPGEFLLSAAFLFALAVLIARPGGKRGRERLLLAGAGALLWIPFLLPGGTARLALSLLLLAAWFPGVQVLVDLHGWDARLLRETRRPLLMLFAAAGAGLVLLIPASGFSAAAIVSYAGSIAGSALLVVALALLWGKARRPRARRKKFDPVPIVKPAAAPAAGPAGFVLALAAVVVSIAISILRSSPLPTPLPVPGVRDFSWESLARLSREDSARRLPDVSDLAAHEAFQETIAFGRPWGLPRRDERVYVRDFTTNPRTGAIVAGMKRVKVFDAEWLAAVFRGPPPGSIESLLVDQRRPMAVAIRGQSRGLLRELPVALLALFIFSAWFAGEQRAPPLMRSVLLRFNGAARRNQVP